MNPVKQIGRYEIPILSVITIKKRTGLLGRIWPGYDVTLTNRRTLRFTEAEKQALDKARSEHELVMHVYGMCLSAGLRP